MPPSPKNTTKFYEDTDENTKPTERSLAKGIAFIILLAGCTFLLLSFYSHKSIKGLTDPGTIYAKAILRGNDGVNGTITFEQNPFVVGVRITGTIRGLDPKSLRGFHIHQYGDLSDGCASTGSHFNPTQLTHGAPSDTVRHVGDLGNIESDKHGVAEIDFHDYVIGLMDGNSIIGRAVVVHTGKDDLGRGDNEDSKKTGNAGGRAACGIIGLAASAD